MALDPIILFFLLGLVAGLARSELRLPSAVYELVSTILLLSIGLKGGRELATRPVAALLPDAMAVIAMGLMLTYLAYPVLRLIGRMSRADAAAIGAHYGSVSVGTYAVAVAYLGSRNLSFEEHMPLLLVLLEVPAILAGILLARGIGSGTRWRVVAHEALAGKGIVLLFGGLVIGWSAGTDGLSPVAPFFFDLFSGVLALFLLDMGLLTASHVTELRRHGLFLAAFGIAMPLAGAAVGMGIGLVLGYSVGGIVMLTTMAASASYIAVPAAMRISVPEANPGLSLAASLGVTFPFNVLVGIPLYCAMAEWIQPLVANGQ